MKRTLLMLGSLVALAAAPAAAQTRVSVALGFGVPSPYVSGYVVIGRPRPFHYYHYGHRAYRYHHHPRALVVVSPRVIVVPRGHVRHRHFYRCGRYSGCW